MCGGGYDDSIGAMVTGGAMTTEDILTYGLLAAPVGFGLSALAGSLFLRGRRRLLSAVALAFCAMALAVPVIDAQRRFGLFLLTEETVLVFLFWAITALYLAHTYYPTSDRRVTLPATLGIFGTAVAATLLWAWLMWPVW